MLPNVANLQLSAVTNAAALQYTPLTVPTTWYLTTSSAAGAEPSFYAPYVTPNANFGVNPIVYTGDPGQRNPFFNTGYVSSAISPPTVPPSVIGTPPYAVYLPVLMPVGNTSNSINAVPAGMPLPQNVAFATGNVMTPVSMFGTVMPPPIPPARLFQAPDAYGAGRMQSLLYAGATYPPAVSNAADSGDPWINNLVANQAPSVLGTFGPSITLNNGFANLPWSGGTYFASGAAPLLPPTGALPPIWLGSPPYGIKANLGTPPTTITYGNGYYTAPLMAAPTGTNPNLGSGGTSDDRQHPYWRTEQLQKAMNLTTVRTHQYAVWITIGFFEV